MNKTKRNAKQRQFDPAALKHGMWASMRRQSPVAGTMSIPVVPAMVDHYVDLCANVFAALGRGFSKEEHEQAKLVFEQHLVAAFRSSSRSNLVIEYWALESQAIQYKLTIQALTIPDAYENWLRSRKPPLFGSHADARVLAVADTIEDPSNAPVLDIGAGTGRNSLALARRGHPVDAVEMTPKFVQMLVEDAAKENLQLRTIQQDVFRANGQLRQDYRLVVVSEVVNDFRTVQQLRELFELVAGVLAPGGEGVFNIFLPEKGYTPEKAAREFSQQCYATIFTREEVAEAIADLSLEMVSEESVHDFEKAHLPEQAWPPTDWYLTWVLARDIYGVDRDNCPVELRWLVLRKSAAAATP
jgi:2-polyprenyl-3-methyl-5-hydroxy-6-metoxy-1,4-benzoquinol methylase